MKKNYSLMKESPIQKKKKTHTHTHTKNRQNKKLQKYKSNPFIPAERNTHP